MLTNNEQKIITWLDKGMFAIDVAKHFKIPLSEIQSLCSKVGIIQPRAFLAAYKVGATKVKIDGKTMYYPSILCTKIGTQPYSCKEIALEAARAYKERCRSEVIYQAFR